jgi:hypothetical protein
MMKLLILLREHGFPESERYRALYAPTNSFFSLGSYSTM